MRILFIIHTPKDSLTAVYKSTAGRADYLRECGHHISVVSPDDFPKLRRLPHRLLPLVFPLVIAYWIGRRAGTVDSVNFHSYSGWTFNLVRRLSAPMRNIHTTTMFHGLEPLAYDALNEEMSRAGRPLSKRYRLIHGWLMLKLIRLSCRHSDMIMCLNNEEARYLLINEWALPGKVVVIPNCVSEVFFIDREAKLQAQQILFVGQWLEGKGIKYLVQAFTDVAGSNPDLQLWCVGTLISAERVLHDFPEALRSRVLVRPRVAEVELLDCYREADLFIFPSLHEGFSQALLEAMAAALPIIATSVGAAPDILDSGKSAIFVPKADAESLTTAIRQLCDDPELRERIGQEAQSRALAYKCEPVYRNYIAVIESKQVSPIAQNRAVADSII